MTLWKYTIEHKLSSGSFKQILRPRLLFYNNNCDRHNQFDIATKKHFDDLGRECFLWTAHGIIILDQLMQQSRQRQRQPSRVMIHDQDKWKNWATKQRIPTPMSESEPELEPPLCAAMPLWHWHRLTEKRRAPKTIIHVRGREKGKLGT